jgi:hypothetical protein
MADNRTSRYYATMPKDDTKPHYTFRAPSYATKPGDQKILTMIAKSMADNVPSPLMDFNERWETMVENSENHNLDHRNLLHESPTSAHVWKWRGKYFLQAHPDPEHTIRAVCINCAKDMALGTFVTHKPPCLRKYPNGIRDLVEAADETEDDDASDKGNKKKKEKMPPFLPLFKEHPHLLDTRKVVIVRRGAKWGGKSTKNRKKC